MPTSTNVTNLKINELTEAQYDTAVQGGVIGANELSILTDVDAGQVIQVATLPTASADELGNIYQFIGTTDANYTNGYFYKCTGAGEPVVYSWSRVDVQPSGSSYTAGTGIDITNGTISVTSPTLTNTATGNNSLSILGAATTQSGSVLIGMGAGKSNSCSTSVIVGSYAANAGNSTGSVYIGAYSGTTNNNQTVSGSVAIGTYAHTTVSNAIQISARITDATNSDSNTFKVANANGNYEIMSADGTIPTDRLTKVNTTVTLAAADWSSNTQTVSVTGMTATGVVMVSPDPTDQSAYTSAGILCTSQATNSLTFTATTTPTTDIDVNVVML